MWIKFCDDDRPLMRAEVPIGVLGLAFQPGLAAVGDPRELRFNLTAAFAWGPALRLLCRPDDPGLPFFALTVRAGRGPLGSPARAPFALAAEFFNLLSSDPSTPAFFLRLKPRLRDFSLSNSNTLRSPADGAAPLAHAVAGPECTAPRAIPHLSPRVGLTTVQCRVERRRGDALRVTRRKLGRRGWGGVAGGARWVGWRRGGVRRVGCR